MLAALQQAEPGIQLEQVAARQLSHLLRREADIAPRMLRPTQRSRVALELADIRTGAATHARYLERAGKSRKPPKPREMLQRRPTGHDRDETPSNADSRAAAAADAADAADPAAAVLAGGAQRDWLPGVLRVTPQDCDASSRTKARPS